MTTVLDPGLRKVTLTAHVTCSVGLLGSIGVFLMLAIAGLRSQDTEIIRAVYLAMDYAARFVIVPLAFAALLTGLIQSLGTQWGLFRHYWIMAKLLVTAFATAVLLAKMELIAYAAQLAGDPSLSSRADLRMAGIEMTLHAAVGLLVLLIPAALSVFKPWGLTAYGRRMQHERRAVTSRPYRPLRGSAPALCAGIGNSASTNVFTVTLRGAQIVWILLVIVVLHLLVMHLVGIARLGH